MGEGGGPLLMFDIKTLYLNFIMLSSTALRFQDLEFKGFQFPFKTAETSIPTLRPYHLKDTEDITTKFKTQCLHIIRIKY